MLKEVAEKRLAAIKEYSELGSGFKIAMRDLEIRGAGNLLGEQQSGHMEAVGYDLYCKMLHDAVKEAKGEKVTEDEFETSIDVNVDAYIPSSYISNEFQKLDIYKRIAAIETTEEREEMLEELIDRFLEPPKSVINLLTIAGLKAKAHKVYVKDIIQKGDDIILNMYEKANIQPENIPVLISKYRNQLKFNMSQDNPNFVYTVRNLSKQKSSDILDILSGLLEEMEILLPHNA